METVRFSLWSGPRNVSTALMYAFAQRSDTGVIDEPFYAHYLVTTDKKHPGWEDVIASQENDVVRVIDEVVLGPTDRPVIFIKQMAHHLIGVEWEFMNNLKNGLLIRDPAEVLLTLPNQVPEPTLPETALPQQVQLYDYLVARGHDVPVLDAKELLLDPELVLTELCNRLGIEFEEAMLGWEAGPIPEDGVWAQHWYKNLHRSTGFRPYRAKHEPLREDLRPLLEECRPYYDYLAAKAIKAPDRITQ